MRLKKYKLSFDIWGLLLFLIIMIPDFVWFSVPAPNDVLLIIFCELDRVLSWYGECGCHIGIDDSSMFGIYVLCH